MESFFTDSKIIVKNNHPTLHKEAFLSHQEKFTLDESYCVVTVWLPVSCASKCPQNMWSNTLKLNYTVLIVPTT